jgi:hypothetical protein
MRCETVANCDPDYTTGKDGSITVHAGACASYFNFPAIAFAGSEEDAPK